MLNYIGHFLKMNALTKENIKNQLFYFSKEALSTIALKSKCGITSSANEFRIKNIPTNDINTFENISPLLCIYKKADAKLVNSNDRLIWNEEKFKKEISVSANAFMTLSLLQLTDYYKNFKNIDESKYSLSLLYLKLSQKQLDFYAAHLRNDEGVFVDKTDLSNISTEELNFEEKNKNFNFSDQAMMMAAYYKYSTLSEGKDSIDYKNFALDIFNMLLQFKDDLYEKSFEELTKVCFGINIFYEYSRLPKALNLSLDIADFINENYLSKYSTLSEKNLKNECLHLINNLILFKSTGIVKFKETSTNIYNKLVDLYSPESGIFLQPSDKKELSYSCDEISLYLISLVLNSELGSSDDSSNVIIIDVYKHQLINSGIISSWPECPDLDNAERYRNFSHKAEDMLEDNNFRMDSVPIPTNNEIAPVFLKNVSYNRKKDVFNESKKSFDSSKNMMLFFMFTHFFNKQNNFAKA